MDSIISYAVMFPVLANTGNMHHWPLSNYGIMPVYDDQDEE